MKKINKDLEERGNLLSCFRTVKANAGAPWSPFEPLMVVPLFPTPCRPDNESSDLWHHHTLKDPGHVVAPGTAHQLSKTSEERFAEG